MKHAIAFSLTMLASVATAHAGPVYHMTTCAPGAYAPGDTCYVAPNGAPPAGYLDGLDQPAFEAFYGPRGFVAEHGQPFVYETTGTNAGGTVVGYVYNDDILIFSTVFIFRGGEVLCCTIDYPYNITGIGDDGTLLTNYGGDFPEVSTGFGDFSPSPGRLIELDTGEFLQSGTLTRIDAAGRIAGYTSGMQEFVLEPVVPEPNIAVPEPSSWMLLLGGLGWLGMFMVPGRRKEG